MNKKIVVVILLSLILLCSILIVIMVNSDKKEKITHEEIIKNSKVIELEFNYVPTYMPSTYKIIINGDIATLEIKTWDNESKRNLDKQEIELIKQALIDGDVISWNGFNETDPDVLDGASFSMYLKLDDMTISAHGSNAWPNNYHKFRDLFYKVVKEYE